LTHIENPKIPSVNFWAEVKNTHLWNKQKKNKISEEEFEVLLLKL